MFVRREVERAVSKQKRVVPVRIVAVTPSAGLELFISGTQWLDAWTGDWSDHMDRLSRELADGSVGRPVPGETSGRAGQRSAPAHEANGSKQTLRPHRNRSRNGIFHDA